MAHCINRDSKEFKDLSNKLNIHPDALDGVILAWQNENNSEAFPSEEYINNYYKLGGENTLQFSSLEDFASAHKVWELYHKDLNIGIDSNQAIDVYNSAVESFGEENVGLIPRVNNTFDVVVREPIFKSQIPSNIFSVATETSDEVTTTESNEEFYKEKIITQADIDYLANQAVNMFSTVLDLLQGLDENLGSKDANEQYFGDEFKDIDFTRLSRERIIKTITPSKIFDMIRDNFFDPFNREDIEDDFTLEKLELIYNNFYTVLDNGYPRLIRNEHITLQESESSDINDSETDTISEEADVANNEEKGRESWQLGFRFISAKESLSPMIKRAFDKLRERDNKGDIINDEYNLPKLVDADVVYNTILKAINHAGNINEMESILQDLSNIHPWIQDVLTLIKKEPFRSQFFQNFRKDFTKYSVVSKEMDNEGNLLYKTTIVNTQNAENAIIEEVENLIKSNTYSLLKDVDYLSGKGSVNRRNLIPLKDTINKLIKTMSDSKNFNKESLTKLVDSNIKNISKVLSELGLGIDDALLKLILLDKSSSKEIPFQDTKAFKFLDNISRILNGMSNVPINQQYNPLDKGKDSVRGYYSKLVKNITPFLEEYIESSTFENGKLYYSFVTPSYLGKLMTNLKDTLGDRTKFSEFMENNYNKYDWFTNKGKHYNEWLRLLNSTNREGVDARNMLDHKVQLHFNGTNYTDLSGIDYTLSLMQEYFADFSDNPNYAWYHVPILADKPSSEFIKFKRYTDKNLPANTGGYVEHISKLMTRLAKQEIRRIKTVRERSTNPNIEKINNFDMKIDKDGNPIPFSGGAEFKFLDFLNIDFKDPNSEIGKLINKNISEGELDMVEASNLTKLLQDRIKEGVEERFQKALKEWEKLGLMDTNTINDNEVFTYLDSIGKSKEAIEDKLREYFWNSMFATSNIIQLTVTDLAYYSGIEDFQKRYAQIHSPALRLNIYAEDSNGVRYSKDGIEKTLYIKDQEIKSDIIDQVAKIFDDKIAQSTSNAQKKGFAKLKKDVLKGFENINVADAQGYTSISGYRKKMGMSGRWTAQMEEAYLRIKSGNYNVSDLDVLWQPLKPFVYTLIEKESYAKGMSSLKVPVQNKNSEYMLMMAGVLGATAGNNKLRGINDFMEKNDIDTIQFESAVKSGKQGVIDINKATTAEEVYNILDNYTYERDTNGNRLTSEEGYKYNEQYIHSIPYEEYGIQQEVPEHLLDTEQLLGSQIKKLIMTDIATNAMFDVNGSNYNKEELINLYYNLLAANINDSLKTLLKELKVDNADIKVQNKALSDLLVKEIKSNARYGPELLRACSLNENGEFVIPLSDPTQSNRIQQLLNSIIKNNITKQKIKGGALVQLAPYGLSEDLNIIFNEDGSVKYFEAYMPAYSQSMVEELMDENGNLDINKRNNKGELILPEELRDLIGYRIPTEDKYSMTPIRIKGFLPQESGSAIMLPKEITLLSGSDYDIDKLYVMLPEFRTHNNIDYNRAWLDFRKEYNFVSKEQSDAIGKWFKESFKDADVFGEEITEEDIKDNTKKDFKEFVNLNKDKYTNGKTFSKVKFDTSKSIEENSVEQRNNQIIDIIRSVLTNKDTADKIFNPGSFDVQKKSARIITLLKTGLDVSYSDLSKLSLKELEQLVEEHGEESNKNIIDPTTQVYFHQLNTTAGKLIGVFANNNSSHAIMQLQEAHFNINTPISFDGILLSSINNGKDSRGGKIDNVYANDGITFISKNIAGFLAASVDAVKDPVLNFMNLNTYTANVAMTLARLGFDSDSIGLFLTQPSIETVTKNYFKESNEGFITVDSVVNDMINVVNNILGGNVDINDRVLYLSNTDFSKDNLAKLLGNKDRGADYMQYQLDVLLLFRELLQMGSNLNELTFITKFDTVSNAVGPTIADSMLKEQRVNKFMQRALSKKPPFSPDTYNVINKSPLLKASYEANVTASRRLFSLNFPHYNKDFVVGLNKLRNTMNSDLDARIINKFINEFISFKLTKDDNVFSGSIEERERFINKYAEQEYFDIMKDESLKNNDLIKIVKPVPKDRKNPMTTLQAKTGGLSSEARERMKIAWTDLLKENKELAIDLFKYNFYRSGFTFSPTSFMHLVPIDVKLEMGNYIESLRRLGKVEGNLDNIFVEDMDVIDDFIIQFKRNNSENLKLVPSIDGHKLSYTNNNGDYIFSENNELELSKILIEDQYADMINLEKIDNQGNKVTTLLMNVSNNRESPIYREITPLGIRNNAIEYSYNSFDVIESVIPNNKSSRIVEYSKTERNALSEQVLSEIYTKNDDIINQMIEAIYEFNSEQIDEIIGKVTDKRSKVIKILREAYPGFKELDKKQRSSIITYFEGKNLKDKQGNNIC